MDFSTESIEQVTTEIWTSILGLDIKYLPEEVKLKSGVRSMIGCIQIAGDWEGAVTLFCPETLVRKATSAMFEMPAEEVGDEEMQDTLGELTNMLAGTIKNMLPANCLISLPSVAEGINYKVSIPGGKVVCQVGFVSDGENVLVTIVERK